MIQQLTSNTTESFLNIQRGCWHAIWIKPKTDSQHHRSALPLYLSVFLYLSLIRPLHLTPELLFWQFCKLLQPHNLFGESCQAQNTIKICRCFLVVNAVPAVYVYDVCICIDMKCTHSQIISSKGTFECNPRNIYHFYTFW